MPRSSARAGAEPAALDESAAEHLIGYLLAITEPATRRAFQQAVGTPMDLRPVEFSLLLLLLGNGRAAPKQIGPALRLPAPHVTTLVDRLAGRGLVRRSRDPNDGRAIRVELTPEGRNLAEKAHRISLTMEDAVLSALTPAERTRLQSLLLKLARSNGVD
jgi:DNA-binding MarR family transcriptional regulator